jgi:hypothetical protein
MIKVTKVMANLKSNYKDCNNCFVVDGATCENRTMNIKKEYLLTAS